MKIRLTLAEATRMFEIWRSEIDACADVRAVEDGQVKLDSVPSARGATHAMDGSLVEVWYRASKAAAPRAIAEARRATEEFGLPRQLYSGRLIDIKRAADGTVYFLVKAVQREGTGFRCFSPSKGQLIEMTINPAGAEAGSRIQPVRAATTQGGL